MKAVTWIVGGVVTLVLCACGPSDKQRAEQAEKTRIECLDKFCPGDVEPKHDMATEVALKVNGQWYIGPKEYFSGRNGAVFYWPSKTPEIGLPDGKAYPERGKPFYDVAVEIFLTGRQRWPTPNVEKPWEAASWQTVIEHRQSEGLRMERIAVGPALEMIRFFHPDGKPYSYVYYVATRRGSIRGEGPAVLSCLISTPPHPQDRCTSGEFWQPDVYADFRFRAKHAEDWPAIHEEIVRVLSLAKKVQP